MASSAAKTKKAPEQIKLADGTVFACSCKSKEFRAIDVPLHLFCRCGKIYTLKDLPPLEGS